MKVAGFTLVVAVGAISIAFTQPASPPLAVAFLYDLTMSAVPFAKPVNEIRELQDVTECVTARLEPPDTLRFGFIASHLYLSRPYRANEMPDFYRKVGDIGTQQFGKATEASAGTNEKPFLRAFITVIEEAEFSPLCASPFLHPLVHRATAVDNNLPIQQRPVTRVEVPVSDPTTSPRRSRTTAVYAVRRWMGPRKTGMGAGPDQKCARRRGSRIQPGHA